MSKVRHRLTRITVTVPPDLMRLADQLARRQALSRSAVLSEALRRHVNAVRPAQVPPVARVAEPAVAPYQVAASTDLAFATDAELVAELQRRLAGPGRRVSAAQILDVDRAKLAELCCRHHIAKLSLFGSVLFGGRRVDLVTQSGLNRHLREPILASAQVFFEA